MKLLYFDCDATPQPVGGRQPENMQCKQAYVTHPKADRHSDGIVTLFLSMIVENNIAMRNAGRCEEATFQ